MSTNLKSGIFFRILFYFLSYIEGIIKSYIFIIIFGLIAIMVTGTDLEKLLVGALSITPGVGLGREGNFIVDQKSIIMFFLVWGAIVSLISEVINKYALIKLDFDKNIIIFGLILHLVSFVVITSRLGLGLSLIFTVALFVTFILSVLVSRAISRYKKAIEIFCKALSSSLPCRASCSLL